jgi:hypothetical protein
MCIICSIQFEWGMRKQATDLKCFIPDRTRLVLASANGLDEFFAFMLNVPSLEEFSE